MRTVLSHAARCAAVLLAGLLASAVQADDKVKPAATPVGPEVHKMVILNGPTTTVHYFSVGLSPSDEATLRDLERAENEAAYADDLQALRREYVAVDLNLEPYRGVVEGNLYGQSISRNNSNYLAGAGFLASGYGYGYPSGYGYGYPYAYPGAFTGYTGAYASYFAGSSSSVDQSLAYGVGNEGALKNALAPVVASQATCEFATSAAHAYTAALNGVSDSKDLRTAWNQNPGNGILPVATKPNQHVTLTLKAGGKTIEGKLYKEDDVWISVETAPGKQVDVRKENVDQINRVNMDNP